ncbi:MAG: flagellar biosynthetic protein FliR [Methyloligella sp.]|nr:MAG: flagellar biosynthetic protein FliR [Methyloligella sp.]
MTFSLEYLPATAFAVFLIFSRIGPLVMMLPGIGEASVPMRSRLAFAVMLTLVLYPVVVGKIPPLPSSLTGLIGASMKEMVIGFSFGAIIKILSTGIQVAGNVIAFQAGLSFAMTADPTTGRSDSVFSSFLMMLSTVMIFAMDLHHLIIAAMYDSYMMFPPGAPFEIAVFSDAALLTVASIFKIGVQLSTPFIVFGLVFFLGLGILSRLIPQIQVFFIAMPANIYIGTLLFVLLLSAMMNWYLSYYEASIVNLMR